MAGLLAGLLGLLLLLGVVPLADALTVVVGGTGFVGSRVCRALAAKGVEVTSVSKSGRIPEWAKGEPWTQNVKWSSVDLITAEPAELDAAMGSASAVISCVGVIDPDSEVLRRGNGLANVNAFASAKRAGVKRACYISVASELVACEENWLPFAKDQFAAYFEGKRLAEQAALDAVGGDTTKLCVLKPTFIYGGKSFDLPAPGRFVAPRVSAAYGSAVEEVLSLSPIQALADAAPGLIKVALRPPSSVEAVATVCALAAVGELATGAATRRAVGTLDGTAALKAAAGEATPRSLREAIDRGLDNIGDFTEQFFAVMQDRVDKMGKK